MPRPIILNDTHSRMRDAFLQALAQRGELYQHSELEDLEYERARERAEIVVVSGGTKITAAYLARAPHVRLIADFGVGYDGLDLPAVLARGIAVTHTPGVMRDDVADLALALLLNTERHLIDAHKFIEDAQWEYRTYPLQTGLTGLRVGIAGLGRIGAEFAARAAACKAEIGYFGRRPREVPYRYFSDLTAMAEWCSALVLTMPASPATFHIVNGTVLRALGADGVLINVARGSLVDTAALLEALRCGLIKGAGLDVFEHEPDVPRELMYKPNVVLCPHAASSTVTTRVRMGELVLANIDAYLAGRPLISPIPECRGA